MVVEDNGQMEAEVGSELLHVLLLEDSPLDAELIHAKLEDSELPCNLVREETRAGFLAALETRTFDLILADYSLPSFDGLSALEMARTKCPNIPFIFVSGAIGEEQAVETLRLGATDYVLKHHLERLVPTVRRALREAAERAERAILAAENARLYREAQAAARRDQQRCVQLRAVADASLLINSAHSLKTMLQVITDEACEIIGAHHSLTRLDGNGDRSQAITAISRSSKYKAGRDIAVPEAVASIESLVYCTNKSVRMTRAALETHLAWSERAPTFGGHSQLRGWLAAPLVDRDGKTVGLIELSDKYDGDFTKEDEAILVQLAQLASVAIMNARLYRQTQQEARRKDEFLAMLAHELRNPLGAIAAAADLMRLRGLHDPTLLRARDTIERQGRHMTRLIDDLLDISRVTRGKIALRKEPLDLATIATNAVQSVRPVIESRGHRLSVCLPSEPLRLEADPNRLEQVVVNLLDNAAKYTDPGGQIWLSVAREGNEVAIQVRDSGIGIAPKMLPCVFDLFAQADQSLARSRGGLGIGLTLVRSLVEMHEGNVRATSAGLGHGSEFVVRLPLGDSLEKASVCGEDGAEACAGQRILIVEDNDDSRQMLHDLLKLCGHCVREAADGRQGIETIRRHPPDVALIDIGLPDLDGYQVAQMVRAEGKAVYLVALTGYGQPDDRRRALAAGFDAHMTKPVTLEELSQMLAAAPSAEKR